MAFNQPEEEHTSLQGQEVCDLGALLLLRVFGMHTYLTKLTTVP